MTAPVTLDRLLVKHAEAHPDQLAVTFRPSSDSVDRRSYGELVARAAAVAMALGPAVRGTPVILALPSGIALIESLYGIWMAGGIAVPTMPPRPGRRFDRLESILTDTNARFLITSHEQLETISGICQAISTDISVMAIEDVYTTGSAMATPQSTGDSLALIQYTSGSIGQPKGVVLTHSNFLANQQQIKENFGHGPDSIVAGWLPMHHDMGLTNIIQPLYIGREVHLIPPETFLMRPIRWLELMASTRATTSGGPNFAYDMCVSRITEEQAQQFDLSNWKVAFNGAEPVRPQTIVRFIRHFAATGFQPHAMHPCYGLAEGTLMVSGKRAGSKLRVLRRPDDQAPRVSCGPVVTGSEIAIVHAESRLPMDEGENGEVWVRGPNVAAGYWGIQHSETFGCSLATGGASDWMRTGDLGCLLDGELLITGRIKDVIIFGGQKHAAEDIEHAAQVALNRGADNACAAFSIDQGESEALVILMETTRNEELSHADLCLLVTSTLSKDFDIVAAKVHTLPRGRLPRTTSGKVRRSETRRLYLQNELPLNEP